MNHAPAFGTVFEFQCRADEYLEARRAAVRVRPLEYWLNRAWGPTLLVLAFVAIARDPLEPPGYLVAAVGVALVLNGTVWLRHRARVEWRTIPRLGYRTWLGIGDAGLRLTTVDGAVYLPWSSVRHVVETARTFALCRAPDDFQVIPKRVFMTESQLAGFRNRLATECPRARSFPSRKKARSVMSRMSVRLLLTAVPFIASAACTQMPQPVSVDRCPPRAAIVASSSPRLAAGGKGVAPREEPSSSDGTTGAGSPRLASGGRGVLPRVETSEPGTATSGTPHLVAGGRGVTPRTECE